jgi:hypothetical protein
MPAQMTRNRMPAETTGERRASVHLQPAGLAGAAHEAPEAVGDEQNARHVGVLLGDPGECEGGGREQQPLRAVRLEEALERDDGPEREDEGVEVLPDEAREVGEVRRGQDEDRVRGRRRPPDPASEGEGEGDQDQPEHGRHQPRREVARADDLVDERV